MTRPPPALPLSRDIEFAYGVPDRLSPLVRRVVAHNPNMFTFTGTGTYLVGDDEVAVVDPGPDLPDHVSAIVDALDGARVTHILVTHTHRDHSPGARLLQERTGAPTYGWGPHPTRDATEGAEEAGDTEFVPDVTVTHGDVIGGTGWTVECLHTPGHISNHVCYALVEERGLFTGDHVMGWSTSVVSPPEGDMGDYFRSLELLLARDDEIYWPTHGPPVRDPKTLVRAFIAHRRHREDQILDSLAMGATTIEDMVPIIYADVAPELHPAAARSTYAHLLHLVDTGRVRSDGAPSPASRYWPS
ncbi:MAG TPA: MBL fold metallo-hydrolase [Acidimicrobiales bacterium]|nr:MBL fold metallo-hydrolase [Acidimicrobiales bacterium]